MKRILIVSMLLPLFVFSLRGQDKTAKSEERVSNPNAIATFQSTEHDYGDIVYDGDGLCTFVFTNTGTEPLMLTNVKASCGCTAPKWSRDPIKPGEKGEIEVKYNTRIAGSFNKTVTVQTNGEPMQVILRIKGRVLPQETTPSPAEVDVKKK